MHIILEQLYPVKRLCLGTLPLVVSLSLYWPCGISQKEPYPIRLAFEQG
jgi:hypothetical protein